MVMVLGADVVLTGAGVVVVVAARLGVGAAAGVATGAGVGFGRADDLMGLPKMLTGPAPVMNTPGTFVSTGTSVLKEVLD